MILLALAAIALLVVLMFAIANRLAGPDRDLVEPWDPHEAGFARCGTRGCPNPHPARPWMADRKR